MPTMIETVFENGVFRPLTPVSIPDNERVNIRIEEANSEAITATQPPRLEPREYPVDPSITSDAEFDSIPVPPKAVATVRANIVFVGKIVPTPYPED